MMSLIICNLIWSLAYVVTKKLLFAYGPFEAAFLRVFFAACSVFCFLAIYLFMRDSSFKKGLSDVCKVFRAHSIRVFVLGTATFFLTPAFQILGLSTIRASDGSIYLLLEPLITILAAALILREGLNKKYLFSLALAVLGVWIVRYGAISTEKITMAHYAKFSELFFILSLIGEAAYSIGFQPLLAKLEFIEVVAFFAIALLIGAVELFFLNVLMSILTNEAWHWAGLERLITLGSSQEVAGFIFLGGCCTAMGYLLWALMIQCMKLSEMALTLYLQPVLGVFWGWLFLSEKPSFYTWLGGVFIILALRFRSNQVLTVIPINDNDFSI